MRHRMGERPALAGCVDTRPRPMRSRERPPGRAVASRGDGAGSTRGCLLPLRARGCRFRACRPKASGPGAYLRDRRPAGHSRGQQDGSGGLCAIGLRGKRQNPWGQSSRHRRLNVQTSTPDARSPFRRKTVSPFDPTDFGASLTSGLNALEPIRLDTHTLDHLSLHTKAVFLKQVAESIPVDQINRYRAVTGGLI